jgi:hypothetical protein
MNCREARFAVGAEPGSQQPELLAHLRECEPCATFHREMLELDGRICRALEIDVPARAPAPVRRYSRAWAIAASLLLAVAAGLALWSARPSDSLASEVVAHMQGEPASWASVERVPSSALDYVLRRSGVRLHAAAGEVVYAHSCWFRGRFVPHLVVRGEHGPVTVLVLRGEHVKTASRFQEAGYSGMLVPAPGGSIAVLGQGSADVEEPARRVLQALEWQVATGQ